MSAPLVVNTTDGTVWTRRTVTRGGLALYAVAGVCDCPEFVMATLSELAEQGIAGSADVLPMPVGPEPVALKPLALTEQQIVALAAAGDRVVNDAVHEDVCACDAWPEKCLSTGNYFMGTWDVSGLETALPAVLALWEQMRGGELVQLRARVVELEAERHSTNEALSDVMVEQAADRWTRFFAPTQALREDESRVCAFKNPHEPHTNEPGHVDEWQCPGVPRAAETGGAS